KGCRPEPPESVTTTADSILLACMPGWATSDERRGPCLRNVSRYGRVSAYAPTVALVSYRTMTSGSRLRDRALRDLLSRRWPGPTPGVAAVEGSRRAIVDEETVHECQNATGDATHSVGPTQAHEHR